ncbi:hypothetical protein EDB86DRAFT_2926824 [Lactarius hatsudake]|nr:hypothetical protein EDB86DRAFT_2926824 [Lactarius hatsudake]
MYQGTLSIFNEVHASLILCLASSVTLALIMVGLCSPERCEVSVSTWTALEVRSLWLLILVIIWWWKTVVITREPTLPGLQKSPVSSMQS